MRESLPTEVNRSTEGFSIQNTKHRAYSSVRAHFTPVTTHCPLPGVLGTWNCQGHILGEHNAKSPLPTVSMPLIDFPSPLLFRLVHLCKILGRSLPVRSLLQFQLGFITRRLLQFPLSFPLPLPLLLRALFDIFLAMACSCLLISVLHSLPCKHCSPLLPACHALLHLTGWVMSPNNTVTAHAGMGVCLGQARHSTAGIWESMSATAGRRLGRWSSPSWGRGKGGVGKGKAGTGIEGCRFVCL